LEAELTRRNKLPDEGVGSKQKRCEIFNSKTATDEEEAPMGGNELKLTERRGSEWAYLHVTISANVEEFQLSEQPQDSSYLASSFVNSH